jgi:hypothetical protein
MNHDAIRKAYPNAVIVDDKAGAFDSIGNKIEINQSLVDAAAIIVAQEQQKKQAENGRRKAYFSESDPLFFKAQRGESTIEEWNSKVIEIRNRFPYAS